jgi:mannose-6-phosphate isomerase-like protein (cupin superfamily)
VTVIDTGSLDWQHVPAAWLGDAGAHESRVHFKRFATEMPSLPAGQMVRYAAGHVEALHSHPEDEVFIVLEGELSIDTADGASDVALVPGSLAFISCGSPYSPRTDTGCVYLRLGLALSPEPF